MYLIELLPSVYSSLTILNLSFILDAPSHVYVVVIWLSDLESISIGNGAGGMEV